MFETIRCVLRRAFVKHEQELKINYPGLNYQIYLREFLSFLGEGKKAEHIVDFSIEQKLRDFNKLSQKGVPFEYILELAHFYGREFVVGPGVLIPRQETEVMIEEVVKIKKQLPQKIDVLDLCSGSGCIGLTIACELAEQVNKLLMTDISKTALGFSEINGSKLEYHLSPKTEISFVQSDLFKKIEMQFHLIVSNPPYIEEDDSHLNELSHEPIEALVSKDNGLSDIKEICNKAYSVLKNEGILIIEHGYNQHQQILKIIQSAGLEFKEVLKDQQGHNRITIASK